MNIESSVIAYLQTTLTVPVYADIPNKRPNEFITVERTGGSADRFIDNPSIAIQCWAKTRYEASELANNAMKALHDFIEVSGIMDVDIQGCYNFPDLDSETPRYQIAVNIITA